MLPVQRLIQSHHFTLFLDPESHAFFDDEVNQGRSYGRQGNRGRHTFELHQELIESVPAGNVGRGGLHPGVTDEESEQ